MRNRTFISKVNQILLSLYGVLKFNRIKFSKKALGIYGMPKFLNNSKSRSIYIICNGPSTESATRELLSQSHFQNSDKICANYMIRSDLFSEIKPTYYCLADPGFFVNAEKHKDFFMLFNHKVHWNMTLYMYLYNKESVRCITSYIKNKNIKIEFLGMPLYYGAEGNRFKSWKSQKSIPSFVNISIMCEYIALQNGYRDIRLYGVEHTFFDNMGVDEDNRLYLKDTHFYGEEKLYITRKRDDGSNWKIKDWLYDKYLTFLEHERMQEYAEYLGARIINCTENSLIDAYPRLSKLKKENKI